jgi:predicted transcriptional regulator
MDSQLTPSEIAKASGSNYLTAEQHLEILEAEGILRHMKFGNRIRFYRFNGASPKARAVKNLIEVFQSALQIKR